MAAQLFVMKRQQSNGPRWFIPKRFRRNPLAYNYYHNVPASVLARVKRGDKDAACEDDETCVICMNYIHFDVDESGGIISLDGPRAPALAISADPPRQSSLTNWFSTAVV